jgi:hypothetical protein
MVNLLQKYELILIPQNMLYKNVEQWLECGRLSTMQFTWPQWKVVE